MIMWLMGLYPADHCIAVLAAWFTDLRLKLRFQGFFKTVIYMPNLIMASAFAMLFFTPVFKPGDRADQLDPAQARHSG